MPALYCEFFGFRESPFNITPNPRFLFISEQHREAFAHLVYAVDNRVGFVQLTGEVGTGKTTLLRSFLTRLDGKGHRTAFIFNPCLSPLELLQSINREFGLAWEKESRTALLEILNNFLLEQKGAGNLVVLVLDEAQNLTAEALEQIRLISNLETDTDKLIQIVLAGQPELLTLLSREDLRQLDQRITVRYHLRPMGLDCLRRYVEHRIELAGRLKAVEFTPAALKLIFRYSRGIPRLVNIACDRSLLVAFTENTRIITGKLASQAVLELVGEGSHRKGATLAARMFRFFPRLKW